MSLPRAHLCNQVIRGQVIPYPHRSLYSSTSQQQFNENGKPYAKRDIY